MALRTIKSQLRKGRKLRSAKWLYKIRPKSYTSQDLPSPKDITRKVVSWSGVVENPTRAILRRAASARLAHRLQVKDFVKTEHSTDTSQEAIHALVQRMDRVAQGISLAFCIVLGLILTFLLDEIVPRSVFTVAMILLGAMVPLSSHAIRTMLVRLDAAKSVRGTFGIQAFRQRGSDPAKLKEESPDLPTVNGTVCINFFEDLDIGFADRCLNGLTPEQKHVFLGFVLRFKNSLSNDMNLRLDVPFAYPDNLTLLRFLIADKYQIEQSVNRLLSAVKFCQHLRTDRFAKTPPEAFEQHTKLRVRRCLGHDKAGRLVIADRLGEYIVALAGCKEDEFTIRELLQCYVYDASLVIKRFREHFEKTGQLAWKVVFVADMNGVGLLQGLKAIKLLRIVAKQMEIYFPETVDRVFLLNASSEVQKLWTMFSKRLDLVFLRKVCISPGVPTATLLQIMDSRVLLREWGGTNDTAFPHVGDMNVN